MISIRIALASPFTCPTTDGGISRSWSISRYKNFELELNRVIGSWFLFEFDLSTPYTRDHWGMGLWFGLFGVEFGMTFYDSRHRDIKWDGEG